MTPQVGEVYEDTYLTGPTRWVVRVMRLNPKSARVEPCVDGGWFTPAGYDYQYRMEFKHFENGRMRLVTVLDPSSAGLGSDANGMTEGL